MMETLTAHEARVGFGDALQKAQHAPVQITKSGRPFAVLMSMEAYQITEEFKLRALKKMIADGEKEYANGDFTDGEVFMQELINGI